MIILIIKACMHVCILPTTSRVIHTGANPAQSTAKPTVHTINLPSRSNALATSFLYCSAARCTRAPSKLPTAHAPERERPADRGHQRE